MRYPALPVNPTAFQVIDSPQKAYLIGFLLADGCVREPGKRSRYRITLRIKAVDLKVCKMLQEVTGGNLRLIENGYRAECDISSDAIAADLIRLGITPRKSFTASLRWDLIPPNLHGAVLAGLIDGDGHMRYKPKQRQATIAVLTASPVLRDQLLERFPFLKSVVIPVCGGRKAVLYNLLVESNRALLTDLITTVYDPLPFAILDRKQAVLEAIRGYLAAQEDYDRRMADVPRLKAAGLTIREIAGALGTSPNPINDRLRAHGVNSRNLVYTEADRQRMRRLHESGLTVLQIHAAIGKGTEQAVRFHLQRLGCLTRNAKVKPRHPAADAVLALHEEGLPAYRIAERMSLGVKVIKRILTDEGITLQGGSPPKMTREKAVWADRELSNGRTLRSVAEELGVSGTLVKIWRRKLAADDAAQDTPRAKPQESHPHRAHE